MPTLKRRLNITLPRELDVAITLLSKRDDIPQSAKAIELLRTALELEEDEILDKIARSRDTRNARYVSHDEVWK